MFIFTAARSSVMGNFTIIDHTADIAVEVSATSLWDLFEEGGKALVSLVVDGFQYSFFRKKKLKYSARSHEELLVAFLNDLNFFLMVKKWIFEKIIKFELQQNQHCLELSLVITGSKFNLQTVSFQMEIKAVTFHNLKISKSGDNYKAILIFDT
jgi:SHS2 domain-containing protein